MAPRAKAGASVITGKRLGGYFRMDCEWMIIIWVHLGGNVVA
jgi:hypothetical protein